jgi:hypothetical protein
MARMGGRGELMLIRLVAKPNALNGEVRFGVLRLRGARPPEGGTPHSFGKQLDKRGWHEWFAEKDAFIHAIRVIRGFSSASCGQF